MYRRFRERFGAAGVVIAVIALAMALVTGAYAAAGGLSSKQKNEVTKIAKKFAGRPGATGPAGPQGAAGTSGANGEKGPKGDPGAPGANGKDGVSVTFSPASEAACPSGGSVFKAANGETAVCNGQTGFTETLPSGKTETGAWVAEGLNSIREEGAAAITEISFPIPLGAALDENHTKVLAEGEGETTECPGTAVAPEAKPGYLCVYPSYAEGLAWKYVLNPSKSLGNFTQGAARSGALIGWEITEAGTHDGWGTWAVTAP